MEKTRSTIIFLVAATICTLATTCYGVANGTSLAGLDKSIDITASPRPGQVLVAGKDTIEVAWEHNSTFRSPTTGYKTIKIKLCFAPISQEDRPWRKTVADNLAKDKTCQINVVTRPYTASASSFNWTIERDVPGATYFIRAYVYNSNGREVAYGQTSMDDDLFQIKAITGRHASLDIASAVFSAFSVVSLFFFFYIEQRKAKKGSQAT